MNREQQEVLLLLRELDTICRKHQLTYYLSPWLTLCAVTGKPFPESPLAGKVLMKLEDMEKLRQILEAEMPRDRALESMKNSRYFPGFFLRYEDKNTLCFRLDAGRNYQCPGMGIDIIPLRCRNREKKVRAWDLRLETGWIRTCDDPKMEKDFYSTVCGCFVRLLGIAGRGRIGSVIYDRLCQNQKTGDARNYTLYWDKAHTYVYPARIFQNTKEVEIEGIRFLVPGEEESYLSLTYGGKYKTRRFDTGFTGRNMMFSARIKYEDFLKECGSVKKMYQSRRKQCTIDWRSRYYRSYFNECWDYAKTCAARQELRVAYREKREYIQELWENRDLVRLDDVFRPCRRMMNRCLEAGEVFELDEDLMEIYLACLKANGNTRLLEKIRQNRK